MKLIDLTDKTFGNLTVIERDWEYQKKNNYEKPYWKCRCSCGKIIPVLGKSLREGAQISCGCLAKQRAKQLNFKDISNQRFGKLIALKYVGNSKWECQCDCGAKCVVATGHLISGHTTSCGCLRSKGELIISQWLDINSYLYEKQYTNQLLRNNKGNMLKIDFAILNNQNQPVGFIEYNGKQHYDINDTWYKPEVEEGLIIKEQYAQENNIPFIIISYQDDIVSTLKEFIFNNIDFSEITE